jgi:arylsulfatase A-like enzyme
MTREQRQHQLDAFNSDQKRKGRPIYTQDPMAPFSHVTLVLGGGDAEHRSMNAYPAFYDADQLYNIATDPNEQTNLANDPENQKKLAEMKTELTKQLEQVPGTFGELKPNTAP